MRPILSVRDRCWRAGHQVDAKFSDFEYLAPCDWSKMPDNSIDVIWSHDVLEHIPPPVLIYLLGQFRRVLKPSGVMAHHIDNSDHWEHKDKSISRVNFLKFGDLQWKAINCHPLFYQNRLRHSDYVRLIQEAGFNIHRAEAEVCDRSLSALVGLRLASAFRQYDRRDLATITSKIFGTPRS
jgi:SAM-dependent methyltransferase